MTRLVASILSFVCALLTSSSAIAIDLTIHHPGNIALVYGDFINRPAPLSSPIRKVFVGGREFHVLPDSVVPSIQSVFLLEHTHINPGETVLDIGSGSGVQAIFAADKASKVVATDISAASGANTRMNVERYQLGNKIDIRVGDLFQPVGKHEKFDVIICNIDYPYNKKTQWLWKVHERFFKGLGAHLNPNGRVYYQIGAIGNIERIRKLSKENGLRIMRMNHYVSVEFEREPIVFMITRDPLPHIKD